MQPHHHDHLQHSQHYQAAIPRQFESQQAPFSPGFETMNNVFDRGFHLGANGHASENDRRMNGGADYGGSSAAGLVFRISVVTGWP